MIDQKFGGVSAVAKAEQEFDSKTVGLVSLQDFRAAREAVEKSAKNLVEVEKQEQDRKREEDDKRKEMSRKKKRKKVAASLSFDLDEDEMDNTADAVEEEEILGKKKKIVKDPTIDTSFLPDQMRDKQV